MARSHPLDGNLTMLWSGGKGLSPDSTGGVFQGHVPGSPSDEDVRERGPGCGMGTEVQPVSKQSRGQSVCGGSPALEGPESLWV